MHVCVGTAGVQLSRGKATALQRFHSSDAASVAIPTTHFIMSDPTIRSGGHTYQHITTGGSTSAHYGDNHYYTLAEDERIKAQLLESLSFPEMRWRRDAVYEAKEETGLYDTSVFDRRDYSDDRIARARAGLIHWLESDSDKLFWISGKPGSGKSVFMKRLRNHANTVSALRRWADGTTLVVLEHYFWVAGVKVQSSLLGLLRTLLHDCVSALTIQSNISLLKTVFSDRWNFASQHVPWTSDALQSAIQHMFESASIKVIVFVDGLDECLPQHDLDLLVDSLLDMCRCPNVKICASSRPWPAFEHGLKTAPRIKLESLTSREMYTYVRDQLVRAESAQRFVRDFRDDTAEAKSFVKQVVKQAEGVFLWTSLVVKHISSERRKGRRLDSLRKCLNSFPEDLESYFRALVWGRIPGLSTNKTDTACVLFLALRMDDWGCLLYYLLSLDLLEPELDIFAVDPQWHASLSSQDISDQISLFLAETCGDLLTLGEHSDHYSDNIIPPSAVEFPHRTMHDFFETEEMKIFLEDHVPVHFLEDRFWEKAEIQMAAYKFFACTRIPSTSGYQGKEVCREIESCWVLMLRYAEESGNLVNISPHKQRWLSTCGQLAVDHQREACKCGGELHSMYIAWADSWSPDVQRYIREVLLKWPHLALCKKTTWLFDTTQLFDIWSEDGPVADELKPRSPLEVAMEMRCGSEYETPHRSMIFQLLGAGCDPNQVHAGTDDSRHSIWGLLVAGWWHAVHGDAEIQEMRAFIEVAILLIRHGAYTWHPTCTTAHTISLNLSDEFCQWTDFKTIVEECVPANHQHELMQIVSEYSEESRRRQTNRKQKLLAFRSLRTSLVHQLVGLQLPCTHSLEDMLEERRHFDVSGALLTSISNWIGLPLKPPQCSHHGHSRPTSFRKAHVCLDCAGFPTICTECLLSDPQAHTQHYVLLISGRRKSLHDVPNVLHLAEYSRSRRKDRSKRLLQPWKLLLEISNRWFEARAEEGGVAMAESPTTENPYGHPFIPMAPKIELPSLTSLTSKVEDDDDVPRYCLVIA
jgi:hypothetical protein